MKRLAAVALCVAFVGLAGADDKKGGDPSGTWKWTSDRGGKAREQTLTLKVEGDKVTGTMPGRNSESKIEDGKFKDGEVTFKVTRERNGQKTTSKYTLKVSGDTLKGKVETERNGQPRTQEIEAKRVKD
jgi:hypothetical protein